MRASTAAVFTESGSRIHPLCRAHSENRRVGPVGHQIGATGWHDVKQHFTRGQRQWLHSRVDWISRIESKQSWKYMAAVCTRIQRLTTNTNWISYLHSFPIRSAFTG